MKACLFIFFTLVIFPAFSQTNIACTNVVAENIMTGNYNPNIYKPVQNFTKTQIVQGIWNNMSTDTMLSNLYQLASFYNRNTGSDTVSNSRGIGAARRWAFNKFQQ